MSSNTATEQRTFLQRVLDKPLYRGKNGVYTVENLPYFLFHLTPLLAFLVPFRWELLALAVGLYYARMFAITGFYHRYFSHRGYKVNSRITQFLMAFWGCTALQQGPLWWAAHHRWHHRYSDTPEDLHSPRQRGLWYAHALWFLLLKNHPSFQNDQQHPRDLTRYPELVWINRFHILPFLTLGVVLFLLGGWSFVVWGLCISTVLLWHGTFTIDSLAHTLGGRRFETADDSRNSLLLAILTLGEGWHNNHHAHQGGAKAGFYWYELDITYYLLRVMQAFGLISNLGRPPEALLERGREFDRLRKEARSVLRARIARRLSAVELRRALQAVQCCVDRSFLRRLNLAELRDFLRRFEEAQAAAATDAGAQPA